ncbi:MAG TPA: serine protease [Candidatus Acidoferrum sp.]|jgi:hypothetical protein|nr:serine protease [Candidatus Acidoferrum sp.]
MRIFPKIEQAWRLAVLAVLLSLLPVPAQAQSRKEPSAWEASVVTVEVSRKQYDYYQPWTSKDVRVQKPGLVVGERQILTTADELFNRTLVRVQKHGRGQWWVAEVAWIDYHANLALVTTTEPEFWRGLKPAALGGAIPAEGTLQILRWRAGNLENRKAEFTQFAVREGQLAAINQAVLEADSDIQSAGWGEPVVANSHVVGLLSAQDGRSCIAIPASFIKFNLDAHKRGEYQGLGYFHFYWQPAQNPASLARLKLTGEPRGVIVIQVPPRPDGGEQVLKTQDIILRVDGFDLDIQGDYEDPEYGHLMLENLATRQRQAGDNVKMQIWREGKPMEVSYRLPKYEYSSSLVPFGTYDQEPEYMIVGGLVFQPLTDSYLQSWGTDWRRRAPFRLYHYRDEPATKERSALVLLSQVLPDAYNIGYQEQKYLVVDKVNGQRINRLPDLRQALEKPLNGYHVIEFVQSDSLRRLVLRADGNEQEATTRILKRYHINQPFQLAEDAKR